MSGMDPDHRSASVVVCDVGPRDGLQNEAKALDPEARAELVNRLAAAGVPRIETASFVNAARVPQMAGAEEVVEAIHRAPGTVYAGLVLNEKGYERLAATGLEEAHFAFAATETFNRVNSNASVEESLAATQRMIERSRADDIRATVTIAASFGCPFEGKVEPEWVLEIAAHLAETGADEFVFADTIGVGVPQQVRHLVTEGAKLGPAIGVHLHNTRNTGVANAYAALEGRGQGHRRLGRRCGWMPLRSAGDREYLHRGPHVHAEWRGNRDGDRSRCADLDRRMARRQARARASGAGLPAGPGLFHAKPGREMETSGPLRRRSLEKLQR